MDPKDDFLKKGEEIMKRMDRLARVGIGMVAAIIVVVLVGSGSLAYLWWRR